MENDRKKKNFGSWDWLTCQNYLRGRTLFLFLLKWDKPYIHQYLYEEILEERRDKYNFEIRRMKLTFPVRLLPIFMNLLVLFWKVSGVCDHHETHTYSLTYREILCSLVMHSDIATSSQVYLIRTVVFHLHNDVNSYSIWVMKMKFMFSTYSSYELLRHDNLLSLI